MDKKPINIHLDGNNNKSILTTDSLNKSDHGKDLISMEDRLHYMFDTYFEMYELPFVEFIFQLKENGNAAEDVKDAILFN